MADKRVTELDLIDAVSGSDLLMVVDDPAGTPVSTKATQNQVLAPAAKLVGSNTFVGDQTVDGDLFVTGEINPTRRLEQLPKINALAGDQSGSRTLLSKSLVAGMSLRHDEDVGEARITVGNYDTQTYQPLLLEAQRISLVTGVFPPGLAEHVRIHPSGGVTVGEGVHGVDPGLGIVQAMGLGSTPLDASQLLSGVMPRARLPLTAAYNGSVANQTGFTADQYVLGSNAQIPADAAIQIGTRLMLRFRVNKTANGTAAPSFNVRFGVSGALTDPSVCTLTLPAQTNATGDVGTFEVWGFFTSGGAAAVLQLYLRLTHALQSSGLSNQQSVTVLGASIPFNASALGHLGISANGGASCGWAINWVSSELTNLG